MSYFDRFLVRLASFLESLGFSRLAAELLLLAFVPEDR